MSVIGLHFALVFGAAGGAICQSICNCGGPVSSQLRTETLSSLARRARIANEERIHGIVVHYSRVLILATTIVQEIFHVGLASLTKMILLTYHNLLFGNLGKVYVALAVFLPTLVLFLHSKGPDRVHILIFLLILDQERLRNVIL